MDKSASKKSRRGVGRAVLFALATLQWPLDALAAEIDLFCDEDYCTIQLYGPIEKGDAEKFERAINRANASQKAVGFADLFSSGGLVAESIKIGDLIRSNLIHTGAVFQRDYYPEVSKNHSDDEYFAHLRAGRISYFVGYILDKDGNGRGVTSNGRIAEIMAEYDYDSEAICASACALAYFGGVSRSGYVGLHHMSVRDKDIEYNELEDILTGSASIVGEYLYRVRAPAGVFNLILATSSVDMNWYSETGADDPIYLEYILSKCPEPSESEDDKAMNLRGIDTLGFEVLGYNLTVPRKLTNSERAWLKDHERKSSKYLNCRLPLVREMRKNVQLK